MRLVLLTQSYPYPQAREATFVAPELPWLLTRFRIVEIVPASADGRADPVPAGVVVNQDLARFLRSKGGALRRLLRGAASPAFRREASAWTSRDWRGRLRISALYLAQAERVSTWLTRGCYGDALLYSYWSDESALGAVIARMRGVACRVVARAHNYDIYAERHRPPFIPGRAIFMENVDWVYCDSQAGADYLSSRYPAASGRIGVARLGIEDPGFRAQASADGILRVLSCSSVTPVKRVDLIFLAMKLLAERHPSRRFEWTHIGEGTAFAALRRMVVGAPENLQCDLVGERPYEALFSHYRTKAVDVFVNTSSYEGVPVSIMEVQACGIPVAATAVGGTPELVNNDNGALCPASGAPEDVASAILRASSGGAVIRAASRSTWETTSRAETNYAVFADRLSELAAK